MSAIFRFKRPGTGVRAMADAETEGKFKSYLDRLVKMIPAEIVTLYLFWLGIFNDKPVLLTISAIVCFLAVIAIRIWGTRDAQKKLPPDYIAVAISAFAFIIWVYALGGPFQAYNILYFPEAKMFIVPAYTVFVPMFYLGPKES